MHFFSFYVQFLGFCPKKIGKFAMYRDAIESILIAFFFKRCWHISFFINNDHFFGTTKVALGFSLIGRLLIFQL